METLLPVLNKFSLEQNCILFDLDGTLADTATDMLLALNHLRTHFNLPLVSLETFRFIAGQGSQTIFNTYFSSSDISFEAWKNLFLESYIATAYQKTTLLPGMLDLLELLQQQKMSWGIVTNRPFALAKPIIEKIPLLNHCQILVAGDSLAHHKPHPLPIIHACHALKKKREGSIYIGDTQSDMQAAIAAGLQALFFRSSYVDPDKDISTWTFDALLDNISLLVRALESTLIAA